MFAKAVLFDLDGTLTDSGEGIINCAVFAMERLGIPVPPREELGVFVGPPLWDTFRQFGVPSDRVDEAVEIFRSRYVPIGKFENTPYSGIRETLEALRAQGRKLYVATSKPEVTAREILEHFDLSRYFAEICGATVDKTRTSKEDVIAYLLSLDACRENSVMVGDTAFDVIGAAWGYGKTEDMVSAGAAAIARSPEDLLRIIEEEAF